jgi:glucose-6-phosphate 1-dehydrogenase
VIERLAIFGATGDLTARYLLPGLAALRSSAHLDDGFQLVGVSREDWNDEQFRNWATTQLDRHAGGLPSDARRGVVAASRYHRADVTDPVAVAKAIAGRGPVAAYLALPPSIFGASVSALHYAGLPDGSTIVLEKPFGDDLAEAVKLNALLAEVIPEEGVFRATTSWP